MYKRTQCDACIPLVDGDRLSFYNILTIVKRFAYNTPLNT